MEYSADVCATSADGFDLQACHDACVLMIQRYVFDRGFGGGKMWPESQALIDEVPHLFGPYLQRTMSAGKIMHNRGRCIHCDEIIESLHRHDFVTCGCGKSSVDGGSWYLKAVGNVDYFSADGEQLYANWPWMDHG